MKMNYYLSFFMILISTNLLSQNNDLIIKFEENGHEKKIRRKAKFIIIDDGGIINISLSKNKYFDLSQINRIESKNVDVIFKTGKQKIKINSVPTKFLKHDLVFGVYKKKSISK